MARWAKGGVSWTPQQIETLKAMRASGEPTKAIAEAIGKTPSATSNFIQRYGDRYGITVDRRCSSQQGYYNGSVPYLHWIITKPWRAS